MGAVHAFVFSLLPNGFDNYHAAGELAFSLVSSSRASL